MNEYYEKYRDPIRRAEHKVYSLLTSLDKDYEELKSEMPDRKADIENLKLLKNALINADYYMSEAVGLTKRIL